MVNGACVEREEQGHSYEPSPRDPLRPNEVPGYHQILLFGQSVSPFLLSSMLKKPDPPPNDIEIYRYMIIYNKKYLKFDHS